MPAPAPPVPVYMADGGGAGPAPAPAQPAPAPAPLPTRPMGGFFDGITLMDVGIVTLVSLALYYSIYYSRTGIKYFQQMQKQTNADIASLKSQMATLTPK